MPIPLADDPQLPAPTIPGERNLGALRALPRRPTFGGGAQLSDLWADTGPRNATFAETQHVQQIRVIFCIPLLSFPATCLGCELSVPQLLQGKFHRKGLYSEATTIIFGME
jgi:hypothetical protein